MNRDSAINRLIIDVAEGKRLLTSIELAEVLEHISRAGFNPNATERVRGRLSGQMWQGRVLRGRDRLPPADVHYLWHVVDQQEWPMGTDQAGYIESIRQVIEDPTSGVFINRYYGALGVGIARESRELRGPRGFDWVLVQYR
ncbi:MAG: hypothetical protein AB7R89_24030 [Dehalococcoidia bacterium]